MKIVVTAAYPSQATHASMRIPGQAPKYPEPKALNPQPECNMEPDRGAYEDYPHGPLLGFHVSQGCCVVF